MVNLKKKKVLVTGGAGFLGPFVVEKLIKRGVSRGNISVPSFGDYDLRKLEDCERVVEGKDIIIH